MRSGIDVRGRDEPTRLRRADDGGAFHVLADGRRLTYATYGDPAGTPVLAFHGTPGARTKFASADAAARERGLRLISIDRWGYAGSDMPPSPRLSRFGEDMLHLCDNLGLTRVGLIGVSGAGPFAAAAAAKLGERAGALALISPVGPLDGNDVDLSAFHAFCFRVLPRVPGGLRMTFAALRAGLRLSPGTAMRVVTARAPPPDRTILSEGGAGMALADCFALGLSSSVEGPVTDMRLFSRRWDIDTATIRSPSRLWIGDLDRNVPQTSAKHLAAAIPGCETVIPSGYGHYWATRHIGEVVDWLAKALGEAGDCRPVGDSELSR